MLNNVVRTPGSKLAIDSHENLNHKQRCSRSPHPYHRNSAEGSLGKVPSPNDSSERRLENARFHNQGLPKSQESDYFDTNDRKRRKPYTSPSESGTEADDERPSFLKGLPAPPSRPRKGLRGNTGFGAAATSSPYLTPSYLDEYRPTPTKVKLKRRVSTHDQVAANEEARQILEKYTKRRRAELVRRVVESLLLTGVGYVTFRGSEWDLQSGMSMQGAISKKQMVNEICRGKMPSLFSRRHISKLPLATSVARRSKGIPGTDPIQLSNPGLLRSCATSLPSLLTFAIGLFSALGESAACTYESDSFDLFCSYSCDTHVRLWL